ncbi:MAG: UDP-3-O-[3-hydroxymyristoyl] glucosamine N-acyltransferase [Candidatus Omnitrophota bacterium]|jgi:UDP-3-O-[3-hydroxymyristoyl] glucosamine N-acyltransferase
MANSSSTASIISISLAEINQMVGGESADFEAIHITGACSLQDAGSGDIAYASGKAQNALLKRTQASAVIVALDSEYSAKPVIRVANPAKAFLAILRLWHTGTEKLAKEGIHKSAVVDETAKIGQRVFLGPGVIVDENAQIGDGCTILANTYIGANVTLKNDVLIFENVTISEDTIIDQLVTIHAGVVIGSDGFGYERIDDVYIKVPQRGNVLIEQNVEIGANTCIDRARFGTTRIKQGTKIDNLVQIGHNVTIGERCLLVSQVGIAGSSELGDDVALGGQVGVSGHIKIGPRTQIAAQSGAYTNIGSDQILLGSPPRPFRKEKEIIVYTSRLPQLFKEVREIKKKLSE